MQVLTEAPSQVSKVQPCGDSSQAFLNQSELLHQSRKAIFGKFIILSIKYNCVDASWEWWVSLKHLHCDVNCTRWDKKHKLFDCHQLKGYSRSPLSEMVATCTWWTIALAQVERILGHLFFVHQNLADAIRPFSPSSAKCIKLRIQLLLRLWQCSLKDVLGKLAGEALQ